MVVEIALADVQSREDTPTFVIARLAGSRSCPVLAAPLHDAVCRLVGMNVVLVHRDHTGELRTYGDARLTRDLASVDLDEQCWVPFEIIASDLNVAA